MYATVPSPRYTMKATKYMAKVVCGKQKGS